MKRFFKDTNYNGVRQQLTQIERQLMSLPSKTATCPCGTEVNLPVIKSQFGEGEEYDICNQVCPNCDRQSGGGNFREGTVSGWSTRREVENSQAVYEAACFDADNNEFYGRGNW